MYQAALEFLQRKTCKRPAVAVVLGSGLGGFAGELAARLDISYSEIPEWPLSVVAGHANALSFGELGGIDVAVLSGRVHLYEGYTLAHVVLGVRVLGKLGARVMVLTNAAGGLNPSYPPGGLVLISDHINLLGANPLTGPNDGSLGPRFPDMSEAYSGRLRRIAREVAGELDIPIQEGVYAAVPGPNYETPAEIRYLRTIGADLVGMSTVPEVIAAKHMGLEVLAISCVTNMAAGIHIGKIDHGHVLETGARVQETLCRYLKAVLPRLVSAKAR